MTEYSFTTERISDVETRIVWSENGTADPLNFWIVAACDVDEAKRLVASGAFDTQDGSTIPTTRTLCEKWLKEGAGGA